jgi:hypothetical protein
MAGFYPDVPAPRIAYDRDGTVGFFSPTWGPSTVTQLVSADMRNWNDENDSTSLTNSGLPTFGGATNITTGLIFPELRDVLGYYIVSIWGVTAIQTSVDSTNGTDGTWVTAVANAADAGSTVPAYRTGINAVSWLGIKAIRFQQSVKQSNEHPRTLHLYGVISNNTGLDKLRTWHPTLDEPLDDNTSADGAFFDWGDVARGTTQDRAFRIKNNSATLTANSIVLSPEVLTDTSPTVASQMTLSDGGAFTGSLNIGSLAPGVISPVITLRRTIASNATLSLWAGRININPGSWT